MKSGRFFNRKHPVKKNPNEGWQRKTYQAEKQRPKQAKPRQDKHENVSSHDVSWKTLLILFLLLASRLPRARAEAPRHSTPQVTPASSQVSDVILFDMCSTLVPVDNTEELIQAKIVGEITSANKQDLAGRIGKLRTAHADIQQMIDTVIQDPNVEILVTTAHNIDENQQSEQIQVSGYYDTVSRYIVIPFEATSKTILHEFRHAFWHIWNLARSATPITHSVQIGGDLQQLNDAFNKGDARLKEYQSFVRSAAYGDSMSKEAAAFLGIDLSKAKRINNIQASLKVWYEHYTPVLKTITHIGAESGGCKKYPVGSKYEEGLTVRSCQEMSTSDPRSIVSVSGPAQTYLEIKTNEPKPFSNLLNQVQQSIDIIKNYYAADSYLYEREAYIYGLLPVQLINLLYPELVELTRHATRNSTNLPAVKMNKKLGVKLFTEYLESTLSMVDINYIKQLPEEQQIPFAVSQVNSILKNPKLRKQLKGILEFLLLKNTDFNVVANNLIQVCHAEDDHRCVVETYDKVRAKVTKFSIWPDSLRMLASSAYKTNYLPRACTAAFTLWDFYSAQRKKMTKQAEIAIADDNIEFANKMILTIGCARK